MGRTSGATNLTEEQKARKLQTAVDKAKLAVKKQETEASHLADAIEKAKKAKRPNVAAIADLQGKLTKADNNIEKAKGNLKNARKKLAELELSQQDSQDDVGQSHDEQVAAAKLAVETTSDDLKIAQSDAMRLSADINKARRAPRPSTRTVKSLTADAAEADKEVERCDKNHKEAIKRLEELHATAAPEEQQKADANTTETPKPKTKEVAKKPGDKRPRSPTMEQRVERLEQHCFPTKSAKGTTNQVEQSVQKRPPVQAQPALSVEPDPTAPNEDTQEDVDEFLDDFDACQQAQPTAPSQSVSRRDVVQLISNDQLNNELQLGDTVSITNFRTGAVIRDELPRLIEVQLIPPRIDNNRAPGGAVSATLWGYTFPNGLPSRLNSYFVSISKGTVREWDGLRSVHPKGNQTLTVRRWTKE